jgi:hypothetical protein
MTMRTLYLTSLVLTALTGCIFVGEFDDVYPTGPTSITYEVCYGQSECFPGDQCEELAVPADAFTDYVNAICTFQCFDDLDCPTSEFNRLPGACIDHIYLGGPVSSRVCVERCEYDLDCDVAAGFGCEFLAGERICVPTL